jgi:alanine racemase
LILTIRNIVSIIKAQWVGQNETAIVDSISIDSRSLQNDENTLFFALYGPNHDGHLFIEELIAKGVSHFVVKKIPEGLELKAKFLIVEDTLDALQKFAAYYRSQFDFPIIGITGSNGKTIIKEWLNFLLSPDYNIIRSPKSYNSQVGVPLSILGINEKHNLGIFEAGISQMHEMDKLQKIIQPTIGILSNIGSAHDEGFSSVAEKIKEKLKLFTSVNVLILNKNKTICAFINPKIKQFSWCSDDKSADVFITKKNIGIIRNIYDFGAGAVLEVAFNDEFIENNKHKFDKIENFPFKNHFFPKVDIANSIIEIELPEIIIK